MIFAFSLTLKSYTTFFAMLCLLALVARMGINRKRLGLFYAYIGGMVLALLLLMAAAFGAALPLGNGLIFKGILISGMLICLPVAMGVKLQNWLFGALILLLGLQSALLLLWHLGGLHFAFGNLNHWGKLLGSAAALLVFSGALVALIHDIGNLNRTGKIISQIFAALVMLAALLALLGIWHF